MDGEIVRASIFVRDYFTIDQINVEIEFAD